MNFSKKHAPAKDCKNQRIQTERLEENRRLKKEIQNQQDTIKALQADQNRREFYSLLVENSLTGIFIVQDDRIVFCNHRFAKMYGYTREELIGKDSLDLVPSADKQSVANLRTQRLMGKKDMLSEYEVRGLRKDGQIIWTMRKNTLVDYNGKPAILGNSIEISERKNVESKLKKSEQILRFLSSRLLNAHENERKRIARELHDTIAQMIKHSAADSVWLWIKKEKNKLIFKIKDNGSGFDIKEALSPKNPEKG